MAESKYARYMTTDCIKPNKKGDRMMMSTRQLEQFGAGNFSMDCIYVVDPRSLNEKNHKHSFDQYLSFFAANPNDPHDFDAELEIFLGEEQERVLITQPTVLHIPAGLHHCPLNVIKINRPLLFVDVALTARYAAAETNAKSKT